MEDDFNDLSGMFPDMEKSAAASKPLTDEQIKHMVDRFLGWKLPANFTPDDGISFDPIMNKGHAFESRRTPSGTNLFDAQQATDMVRYMVEGLPPVAPTDAILLRSKKYARLCGIATVADALTKAYPRRCIAAPSQKHPEDCHCGQVALEQAIAVRTAP